MMEKVKILWSGITGKVAKEAVRLSTLRPDVEIVAGISRRGDTYTYDNIKPELHTTDDLNIYDIIEEYDVIVDFSHPDAFKPVAHLALQTRKPLVIGTKGLTPEQKEEIKALGEKIPVYYSDDFGCENLSELCSKVFDTAVYMKTAKAGAMIAY